jgi:glycosyltransferase involved in cell wall biosynthesis
MTEMGYNQVKKFSWEKTARETLKVLEELGNAR